MGATHTHQHNAGAAALTAEGLRAVRVGVAGLTLTMLAQAALLVATGSIALLADTAHNGIDVLGTLVVGVALGVSRRGRSERFGFGLHRSEDVAGLFVVALIGFSAALVLFESINGLSSGTPATRPWVVLAAGLIGFSGNEAVAQYKIRVARAIGSQALAADGTHSRSDGFTSLGVVAAAIGMLLGQQWIDPAAGVVIGIVIAWTGYQVARPLFVHLLDGADPQMVRRLGELSASVADIVHVNDLRVRHAGRTVQVVSSVCVPAYLSLDRAHVAAENLRGAWMHELPAGSTVDIHVDPYVPGVPVPHPADEHPALIIAGRHEAQ